jgi:replicative DNA helicase
MTRDEIIAANPIEKILTEHSVELIGSGNQRTALCPFHEDGSPSFSVNITDNTWHCHAGCGGGGVIDLIARFDKVSAADVLARFGGRSAPRQPKPVKNAPKPILKPVCHYTYCDALGNPLFRSYRYDPKTFKQGHLNRSGEWEWGMDGVERVLYRLPQVSSANEVWVVEGEKDADNLSELGFCATCNIGGAGKWLDSYTETLAGKDIVICGDNDEPGQKHVRTVFDSVAGKVKSTRLIKVPSPHKDASDYIAAIGKENAQAEFARLRDESTLFSKGINIPLYTIAEMEQSYVEYAQSLDKAQLNLANWIPSLGREVRGLVPGEFVIVLADTGTGKTALLQNLSMKSAPLKTVLFELELPSPLMFERFLGIKTGFKCSDIENGYRGGDRLGSDSLSKIDHLLTSDDPKMNPAKLEELINKSELKFGERPRVVLVDYIGLMKGIGRSRYEMQSNVAEELKIIAKATNVVMVASSQVHRKEDKDNPEIFLHDAKDSGSIENSAGLVLGAWRDREDPTLLYIKILKNTKGRAGLIIPCNFDGSTMRITERARFNDVPAPK